MLHDNVADFRFFPRMLCMDSPAVYMRTSTNRHLHIADYLATTAIFFSRLLIQSLRSLLNKFPCYTSQIKCVFQLGENISRGQDNVTPWGE